MIPLAIYALTGITCLDNKIGSDKHASDITMIVIKHSQTPQIYLTQSASWFENLRSLKPPVIGVDVWGWFRIVMAFLVCVGLVSMPLSTVHMMVCMEEEHQVRIFDEVYREYDVQVPMYLGPKLIYM